MYENRHYAVFSIEELNKIDFNQILETSQDTLRLSVDGKFTFVKWNDTEPTFVKDLVTLVGIFDQREMKTLLSTPEWTPKQIQY